MSSTKSKLPSEELGILDSVWLKASVVGGLWASFEIIIGSFLHNLKIPFAGSTLAALGVMLMISFYVYWPSKGLIWRAGIICALMKSISPSAVILGPMIGILLEAFILEMLIRIIGSNLLGYTIGGALSVMSALLHKVFSLLILYGFNIVKIYLNIFYYASKQINIQDADPWVLLLILVGIYWATGIIAALIGYFAGKKSGQLKMESSIISDFPSKKLELFTFNEDRKLSVSLFILHLVAIPLVLFTINQSKLYFSVPIILAYCLFCIFYYKSVIRRLKKPFFWIQLVLILLLAGLFWADFGEEGFSIEGLLVGLEMNLRAIFVVIAFSSLSIEIRNPVVKTFLFKKGARKLYLAVGLSFSSLPIMIKSIPQPKEILRKPFQSLAEMINYAGQWLETYEQTQPSSTEE